MPPRNLPKFFITHSWHDVAFARRLADDLRAYGLDGFFDVYSVKPGDDIVARINKGLAECDVYVPVLSSAAFKSPWCDEEISAAIMLSKQPGRGGRPKIIPLLIEDCASALPPLLQHRLYINAAQIGYHAAVDELVEKGFGIKKRVSPDAQSAPALLTSPQVTQQDQVPVVRPMKAEEMMRSAESQAAPPTVPPAVQTVFRNVFPRSLSPATIVQAVIGVIVILSLIWLGVRNLIGVSPFSALLTGSIERRGNDNAEMAFIPAGDFVMGSETGNYDEKPQRTVYLDSFWIDQFEVTNALYKKCVDASKCRLPAQASSPTRSIYFGNAQFDNYPVVYVSWDDADAYCKWAGKRLPTEAEWENAARGTDGRIYPWGDTFNKNNLNSIEGGRGNTASVGSYPDGKSPYQVMDMAGNVWEWVADYYDDKYYQDAPPRNPKGPAFSNKRMIRGGAEDVEGVRASRRQAFPPESQSGLVGFRCAQ